MVLILIIIIVVFAGITILNFISDVITKVALNAFNATFGQANKILKMWTYSSLRLAKLLNI